MSGQDWTDKWLQKRSLLELWSGVIGTRAVERQAVMSRRNQEAENRAVRRKLWKNDGSDQEGDDMGDTILGDVSIVQPAAPQSRGLSPLLAAALGAALPGVGAAGFFANQILNPADPAPIVEGVDTSVKIRLGKIGDFLPDQPGQ
jgi:hypothetical protein